MNEFEPELEFEKGLRTARARQVRLYIIALVVLLVAVAAVALVLPSTNAIRVTILPPEAEPASKIVLAEGIGVTVGDAVYTISRTPLLRISAPGFKEIRRTILPEERGRRVTVTLMPLPGRVLARTLPPRDDSRWSFDGRRIMVGPMLDVKGQAGSHDVTVDHPFFIPVSRTVELVRGETTEVAIALTPVVGQLTVVSQPAGAAVKIAGVDAGTTPLNRSLDGGEYSVTVTAPGRKTLGDVVRITNDQPNVARDYRLLPFAATLQFDVAPSGGELLVDGRRVDPEKAYQVSASTDHTIVYLLDGYKGKTLTVQLHPDEVRTIRLGLAVDLGLVEIVTDPAAEIYVDNRLQGKGSATLELPAVPVKIELRRDGYREIIRNVVPSSTRPLAIRETLLPEATVLLAEAPRVYTNSIGMELVLFEPNDKFVMGAPRHEIGQRANEFERHVWLTRPFYAAKHETTNGQVALFRGGRGGPPDHAVSGVSWQDAATFANWLSTKEGLVPFYDLAGGRMRGINPRADGYRLLSEAEWEWLARKAGRPVRTIFPWGNVATVQLGTGNIADESANGLVRSFVPNYNDGYARIAPVGRFAAEASGLFDLTGNVSEWVHDWYSLKPPAKGVVVRDPLGPAFGDSHVVRGSSWRSGNRSTLRAAYRDGVSNERDDVGFRIGRYLHGEITPE